jgi:hypothetical protein
MADRRAQEGSEKRSQEKKKELFFSSSFYLAVARSAAKSFSLAVGNCLERALRRTTKKNITFISFPKGIKTKKKRHVRFRSKLNKTTLTALVTTAGSALSKADRSTQ